jgi:hypothetical protein
VSSLTRRGTPVACSTPQGPLYARVFGRPLPREYAMGVVYLRVTADHALRRKGDYLHVRVQDVKIRVRATHASCTGLAPWLSPWRRSKHR